MEVLEFKRNLAFSIDSYCIRDDAEFIGLLVAWVRAEGV